MYNKKGSDYDQMADHIRIIIDTHYLSNRTHFQMHSKNAYIIFITSFYLNVDGWRITYRTARTRLPQLKIHEF